MSHYTDEIEELGGQFHTTHDQNGLLTNQLQTMKTEMRELKQSLTTKNEKYQHLDNLFQGYQKNQKNKFDSLRLKYSKLMSANAQANKLLQEFLARETHNQSLTLNFQAGDTQSL